MVGPIRSWSFPFNCTEITTHLVRFIQEDTDELVPDEHTLTDSLPIFVVLYTVFN